LTAGKRRGQTVGSWSSRTSRRQTERRGRWNIETSRPRPSCTVPGPSTSSCIRSRAVTVRVVISRNYTATKIVV